MKTTPLNIPANYPLPAIQTSVEPYAHVVNPSIFETFVDGKKQAATALGNAIQGKPSKDGALANMEDTLKRGGGLAIATLATLGLTRRIFGIGEFLGFASWFGAMGVTPQVINALVRLKTGVDLNKQYYSTYGERQQLFKDPNYLPLHILPDREIEKAARKLKISQDSPTWRQDTEDRIRQVAAQSRTWWMLVAGPATPVISGLTCDLVQDPLTGLVNKSKLAFHQKMMGRSGDAAAHVGAALDQLIGELPESELSRWWKKFSRQLITETGLDKALPVKQAIGASRETLVDTMVAHFDAIGKSSVSGAMDSRLNTLKSYLSEQESYLAELEERAEKLLKQQEGQMDKASLARKRSQLALRMDNAKSTLNHYDALLKELQTGTVSRDRLHTLMTKPVLPEVDKLLREGRTGTVKELIGGGDSLYRKLRAMMEARRYGPAFQLMGASPRDHLLVSMKDFMLRRLWRRRIPMGVGGTLLLSTLAYVGLYVGKTPASGKPPQSEPKPAGGGHFA